jgi:iron-sulfur cluster assembly accessory protein
VITLSEKAASQIKELIKSRGTGDALRLSVDKGGCSGMQYNLDLGTKKEDDEVIARDGAEVVIDKESLKFLGDSVIDYDDSLSGAGFRIVNSSAERSCGCGKSFEPNQK